MGRVFTPKFVLHFETTLVGYRCTPQAWHERAKPAQGLRHANGTPTAYNIDKWVSDFEDSLRPGGVNAHLGIFSVVSARIVNQRTGQVVAEWTRKQYRQNEPKFQVVA